MNERIKILRKSLGLTQQNFAIRIGMKQNSIALIESGRNTSDQTILSICREFNVNEEWLRTGKGEMFNSNDNPLLEEISTKYNLDDFQTKMIEMFLKLDEPKRKVISDYIKSLIDNEITVTEEEPTEQELAVLPANDEIITEEEPVKTKDKDIDLDFENIDSVSLVTLIAKSNKELQKRESQALRESSNYKNMA